MSARVETESHNLHESKLGTTAGHIYPPATSRGASRTGHNGLRNRCRWLDYVGPVSNSLGNRCIRAAPSTGLTR